MSEMFEAIEKQAQTRDALEAAAREGRRAELLTLAEVKRRKATKAFVLRLVVSLVLILGLMLATGAGLISWLLAVPIECGLLCWAAVWFGAWLQFMFAKEGLFK